MHGLKDETVKLSNMRTLDRGASECGLPVRALELEAR